MTISYAVDKSVHKFDGADKEYVLSNANMRLTLSARKGLPSKLYSIHNSIYWAKACGHLEIYDELIDRRFTTAQHPNELSVEVTEQPDSSVIFIRRFADAEWQVRESFRAELDAIYWEVELLLDEGAAERSVRVRQLIPWPISPWGWRVWSARFNFPSYVHNLAGLHLEYGDVCFGTTIPVVTIYDPVKDIGLAIAKPFGSQVPRLRFCFSDYRSDGVTVQNDLLGLRKNKPLKMALMLRFHEGCFRPTLAWLLEKYPEYFRPPNPNVRSIEGGSTFGPPQVTREDAARLASAGVNWYEIHHSMPYFGEYCPEYSHWADGSRGGEKHLIDGRPGQFNDGKPTTYQVINDCGKLLKEYGIGSLLYFQVTGDAQLPVMEEKFPESLARDTDGNLFPTCPNSVLINSDPSLPFGRDMERQISVLLDRFPEVSGVFIDQACYNATDMAHDDGLTMYKCRPAYRLRFCFDKHLPNLCRRIHEAGKFVYTNGPYDIELQKNVDGNMAESTTAVAASMRYMHIEKPLIFFAYYKDEVDIEEMFQQCLLAGASWAVWKQTTHSWFLLRDLSEEQKKVSARYIPLCRKLLGRKILLEPNPLVFPKHHNDTYAGDGTEVITYSNHHSFWDWEIFHGADGNILISLVSSKMSVLHVSGFTCNVQLILRVNDVLRVTRAYALGVDYDGMLPVETQMDGEELILTVPKHGVASLIVLELDNNVAEDSRDRSTLRSSVS